MRPELSWRDLRPYKRVPFLPTRTHWTVPSGDQKVDLSQTLNLLVPDLRLSSLQTVRNKFWLFISHPVFCYSSPNGKRQIFSQTYRGEQMCTNVFQSTMPSKMCGLVLFFILFTAVQLSFLKQYQICEPVPLAFYILRVCVLKFLLKYFWKCFSINLQHWFIWKIKGHLSRKFCFLSSNIQFKSS